VRVAHGPTRTTGAVGAEAASDFPTVFDRATRRALSHPLAGAFLDGAWTEAAMARRARGVLDRPAAADWLRPLVREVLAAYARAPRDRPRELAAYVEIVLAEQARAAPRPRASRPRAGVAPAMGRTPWPVPAIPTLGDLAAFFAVDHGALAWLADARGLERRDGDDRLRHYRYAWVPKRSGPPRLIEAPKARLKAIQRRLLREVLLPIGVHDAAHGFVRHRSAVTNAARHAGRAAVLGLDLEDFFGSVRAGRVYGAFRTAGYPEGVAHALTALCTNVAPGHVLAGAPFEQRRRLRTPHLPQGAPTSPALANLAAFALDRRLAGLADATATTYTRYADDLTFSGDDHAALQRVRRAATAIARDEGFRVHPAKTRFITAAGRQRVTGAVVNARPNLARPEYDRLRAALHAAERGDPVDRARLLGRIAWLAALHPARGARLRARFDALGPE